MPKQSNMRPKNIDKSTIEFMCVVHLLLGMGPAPFSVINIFNEMPLKKTNLSYEGRCQLEMACRLGMGAHVHFPLLVLGSQLASAAQAF